MDDPHPLLLKEEEVGGLHEEGTVGKSSFCDTLVTCPRFLFSDEGERGYRFDPSV